VYIPCFEGSEPPSQEVLSFSPSEEKGRILYVDDEAALVEVGSIMLSKIGYDVVPSTSSRRALELFQTRPDYFEAAVLDMTMPGMTGLDLAVEMMKLRPGFPTIIVTGYSDLLNMEKLKAAGVREVLLKPFSQKDLADSVRRARGKNG
jgi:CheY-like chemotaxis protein